MWTENDDVEDDVEAVEVGLPVWGARYPGQCPECGLRIMVGDHVMWMDPNAQPRVVVHAPCPEPYAPVAPCYRCWTVPATNGACGCEVP